MNDENPEADPEADPGDRNDRHEEAHIRALLAELGSGPDGAPMPPAVADRLDDTLARLVAERGSDPLADDSAREGRDPGSVVPLRRGWVPRATAAAAAVIVLGAGGVAAVNLGLLGGGGGQNSGSTVGDNTARGSAPEATTTSPGPDRRSLARQGRTDAVLPRLSSASFTTDVTTLLRRRTALLTPEGRSAADSSAGSAAGKGGPADPAACAGPEADDGAVLTPVHYDGRLAALVIHPERNGSRLVEAWTCNGGGRLASTTLTP